MRLFIAQIVMISWNAMKYTALSIDGCNIAANNNVDSTQNIAVNQKEKMYEFNEWTVKIRFNIIKWKCLLIPLKIRWVFDFRNLLRPKMFSIMNDSSMSLFRSMAENLLNVIRAMMLATHNVKSIRKHQQNVWELRWKIIFKGVFFFSLTNVSIEIINLLCFV